MKRSEFNVSVFRNGFKFLMKLWALLLLISFGSAAFSSLLAQQQTREITGTVTDSKGQPIPGASIVVKGTTTGQNSDINGKFRLTVPADARTLVISFVGTKPQEIDIAGRITVSVQMEEENVTLSEIVVTGYGTQTKRDLTGSITSVKIKDVILTNNTAIDNALQGKVAGVVIDNYTSQPGGASTVIIRGSLSPNGSNSPLYVIDGLPILNNDASDNFGNGQTGFWGATSRNPLNTINPNDIESIDVLKDASAAAIYGSAAANGVILITTKRGKEGAINVTYNSTYSVQKSKDYLEPFNAHDFMKYHELFSKEYYLFQNKLAPYGDTDPASVVPYVPYFSQAEINAAGAGIDWFNYILRDGSIMEQNLSLSSGNKNTKIYASFNYLNNQGLVKNSGLTRYSGKINLDQEIGKIVTFRLGVTYSEINNNNQNTGYQSDPDSPSIIQSALRFAPTIQPYDSVGNLNHSYYTRTPNPLSWLMVKNLTKTKRFIVTPQLDFKLLKDLKLTITGGIDQTSSLQNMYVPVAAQFQTAPIGDAVINTTNINNYSSEAYLNYNKEFNRHKLTFVIGGGFYKTNNSSYGMEGLGFFTDLFGTSNIGIAENKQRNSIYSGLGERSKLSQFLRLTYGFANKYLLTFNSRFDGSSIWAPGHKWGYFPGISAAWVLSEENFIKDIGIIGLLKLRAGYGTVGNEGMLGNYAYSLYGTYGWNFPFGNPSTVSTGVLQTQLGNPKLTWETDKSANFGIDYSLVNDRIGGSFDYFIRTAKNLFDWQVLPSNNAIGRIGANIGSTRSRGFEITLKSVNIQANKFRWATNVTFASYKSFWLERNTQVTLPPYVGKNDPIHAVYGWRTDGIIRKKEDIPAYQSNAVVGNVKYVDVNKDGVLDIKDVVYLGNTDPKASYGLGNTFTYKGFELYVFLYGTFGGLQLDGWGPFANPNGTGILFPTPSNGEIHNLQSWTSFNPNGKYPGLATDVASTNNPSQVADFGARNVYFFRVKNLTFSYQIPQNITQITKFIASARLFVDLQNFFVFGNYSGIDPEMERNNFPYPVSKTTTFGINIVFN